MAELDRTGMILALEGPDELGKIAEPLARQMSLIATAIPEYKDEVDFIQAHDEITEMISRFISAA